GPSRPRNKPSNVIIPGIASRLRTFGAESRSSVGKTRPLRSNVVRAARSPSAGSRGGNDRQELDMLWSFICSSPYGVRSALETEVSRSIGPLRNCPIARFGFRSWARYVCNRPTAQRINSRAGLRNSHEAGTERRSRPLHTWHRQSIFVAHAAGRR